VEESCRGAKLGHEGSHPRKETKRLGSRVYLPLWGGLKVLAKQELRGKTMMQLILAIVAIALISALAVASINYMPVWTKAADDAEQVTRSSLNRLEQAYDVLTRANNGDVPVVQGGPDGGFSALFLPTLRLAPAAPTNFRWVYGQHAADGSPKAGMNYFCLHSNGADEGAWRGIQRARAAFSSDQYFVSSACDSLENSTPSSYPSPAAVTFFVSYVPGITR
jgi:hypothetical protein